MKKFPLSVYLAHNFLARDILKPVAEGLRNDHGIRVTSRWIFDDYHLNPNSSAKNAEDDCEDISSADALFLFVDQYGERPGRGKWFEFGYAVAMEMPVYLIGKDTGCVFVNLPSERWEIYRHDTLDSAVQALKDWGRQHARYA